MNPRPAAPQMFGQQSAAVGQFLGQHQQQMGGASAPIRRSRFDTGPTQTMNPVTGPAAGYVSAQQPPNAAPPQPLLRMGQQQSWPGQPPSPAGLRPQASVVQPLMSLNLNQPPNFQPPPQNWPQGAAPAVCGARSSAASKLVASNGHWSTAAAQNAAHDARATTLTFKDSLNMTIFNSIGNYGLHPTGMRPPLLPVAPQPPRPPFEDAHLVPKVPYYDLPAALMVPLVKLSDHGYKSLDPSRIRLPPPMAPNERLVAAVDAFYAAPNHENPRDGMQENE
uniref:DUF7819 domain-containing protein n=1 Tax=Romanomermis culicivorax TaxID=13658 RepID=A0A915JD57_ROMCU